MNIDFKAKSCYILFDGSSAVVRTRYNQNKDLVFVFAKGGGNGLPDFRKVYTVTPDGSEASVLIPRVGDMIGPHIVKAAQNADGDTPENVYFTGGNHQTNNGASGGAVTARNESFTVFADGQPITEEALCDEVILKWTNYIQAYNTTKSDGNGREVIKEDVTVSVKNCRAQINILHTALEDIERSRYYGLQLMNSGFSSIEYINGEADTKYEASAVSSCGNQSSRSYIATTESKESCRVAILNSGLGNFEYAGNMDSIFVSNNKTYFSLVGTKPLTQKSGDVTLTEGYYDFG